MRAGVAAHEIVFFHGGPRLSQRFFFLFFLRYIFPPSSPPSPVSFPLLLGILQSTNGRFSSMAVSVSSRQPDRYLRWHTQRACQAVK